MGSSAFEIVFMPVLRGTVYGIVMGMAMLALMRALQLPRGTDTGGSNSELIPENRVRSAPGA
jgi:hypothetical protein